MDPHSPVIFSKGGSEIDSESRSRLPTPVHAQVFETSGGFLAAQPVSGDGDGGLQLASRRHRPRQGGGASGVPVASMIYNVQNIMASFYLGRSTKLCATCATASSASAPTRASLHGSWAPSTPNKLLSFLVSWAPAAVLVGRLLCRWWRRGT